MWNFLTPSFKWQVSLDLVQPGLSAHSKTSHDWASLSLKYPYYSMGLIHTMCKQRWSKIESIVKTCGKTTAQLLCTHTYNAHDALSTRPLREWCRGLNRTASLERSTFRERATCTSRAAASVPCKSSTRWHAPSALSLPACSRSHCDAEIYQADRSVIKRDREYGHSRETESWVSEEHAASSMSWPHGRRRVRGNEWLER